MKIVFLGNFGVSYSSENHHKATLESLGHEVVALQESVEQVDVVLDQALSSDLFIWVHTHFWSQPADNVNYDMYHVLRALKDKGVPSMTYHLDLWFGLDRQKDLEQDAFYKHIGHFFTVDKLMAEWFNENTGVKGHYLHAGVFDQECNMLDGDKNIDVLFVGSKGYHHEWQYRPKLINWLAESYPGFRHAGGDGMHFPTTRGYDLNRLYANSKVTVGDSLCLNFDYPYYWSDRVYETLGRGGFMIHPFIEGMDEDFEDRKHLVFYEFNNFDDLKSKIDYYLTHDEEREAIRLAGHEHVKTNHTYKNRWRTILKELGL